MHELVILCSQCEDRRAALEGNGFIVHSCDPIPDREGFCRILFSRPPAEAATSPIATRAGAGAIAAAPVAVAASAARLTPTQIATVQAIVNLFETSEVRGVYGQVTLIPGDTGRLTYGRSQTTLGSGGLADLLNQYCANPGARFGARLRGELPRLAAQAPDVDTDRKLHNVLRACADDPVMRELQDAFFDERYWRPAARIAERHGVVSPLGIAVIYDSQVHGSWLQRSREVDQMVGTVSEAGESKWIDTYVTTRRNWLAHSPRADLRATVYRMDAFRRLIDQGAWGLPLPLVVRGKEISATSLKADPPGCYDGPQPGSRPITMQPTLLRGLDVRLIQLGLSDRGMDVLADGVYGRTSSECVQAFQLAHGQPATGVADPALIASLIT